MLYRHCRYRHCRYHSINHRELTYRIFEIFRQLERGAYTLCIKVFVASVLLHAFTMLLVA